MTTYRCIDPNLLNSGAEPILTVHLSVPIIALIIPGQALWLVTTVQTGNLKFVTLLSEKDKNPYEPKKRYRGHLHPG